MICKLFITPFLLIALTLTGCLATDPNPEPPKLTFQHLPKIALQASEVQMVNASSTSVQPPHVAHRFPVPPAQALTRWAEDRLQVAGSGNTARFTILKADVIETKLKTDGNLTGLFKKEISEKYDAVVEASLEITDPQGVRRAIVISSAQWTRTVREDATLADRKQIWFEIVEKLMDRFNTEMEKSIRTHMAGYVR